MYFLFVIFMALFFAAFYFLLDRDIMQPAVFLMMFFLAGALFAFHLYDYWQLDKFEGKSFQIIMVGLISFAAGSILSKTRNAQRIIYGRSRHEQSPESPAPALDVNGMVLIVSVAFCLVTAFLFVENFGKRVLSSNVFRMILEYKESRNDLEARMPGYLNAMFKALCALAHVQLFIFIHNSLLRRLAPKDFFLLVPAIMYAGLSVLGANRGNVLILILDAFAVWYILHARIWTRKGNLRWRFFLKSFAWAAVFLVAFWGFMVAVRQKEVANAWENFLTYICSYFSGPLASLNLYVRQGGEPCAWWGQETFVALNNNLNSLLGVGSHSARFLEFRSGFGFSTVNIYTSFRRFYHDFGLFGVVLLSSLQGFLTSKLYYRARLPVQFRKHFFPHDMAGQRSRPPAVNPVDFTLVTYGFFFYTVPYTLTDEFFYSSNVSISGAVKFAMLAGCYWFTLLHVRRRP